MPTEINLVVTGQHDQWCISMDSRDESGEYMNGSHLGDELTEAMFHWALGRHIRMDTEVKLLGQLLARSLFPAAVASKLTELVDADEIFIRLRVQADSELVDIPWELTAFPNRPEIALAADDKFRFVRVINSDSVSGLPDETKDDICVLNIFGLPHEEMWGIGKPDSELNDLWERTKDVLADNIYKVDRRKHAEPAELREILRDPGEHYDVLHYIGLGTVQGGTAKICLVDEDGMGVAQDLKTVLQSAGEHGVKVVVLEFIGPSGGNFEPIGPQAVGEKLEGSVEAVLLTRVPLSPAQLQTFNRKFYSSMAAGNSIETAVQRGRDRLRDRHNDASGFGCFSLITGLQADLRLVPARLSDPKTAKTSQPMRNTSRETS